MVSIENINQGLSFDGLITEEHLQVAAEFTIKNRKYRPKKFFHPLTSHSWKNFGNILVVRNSHNESLI